MSKKTHLYVTQYSDIQDEWEEMLKQKIPSTSQRDGILVGVQRLVSTYSNCNPVCSSQNSKCQFLANFFILGGGGEGILG